MLRGIALAVVLLVGTPATAGAVEPTAPGAGGSPPAIRTLADRITTTALRSIDDRGRIWDPIGRNLIGYYGPAGFGYAGLRAAARTGDRDLRERAIRALMLSVRERHATPFDQWLVAKAYRWAHRRLAADRDWQQVAPQIAAYLDDPPFRSAAQPPSAGWIDPRRYNNWKLVELAARTTATAAGRFPASPRRSSRLRAIGRLAIGAAATPVRSSWIAARARALSDPPSNPIAYSTLSAVMLRDVGLADPPSDRVALRRLREQVGRYLAAVMAPNGTLAWSGRSAELSWTLAAAMVVGADRDDRAGRGMANAAWRRLRDAYGIRPDGYLAIAPVLRDGDDASGIDRYANTVIYGGLTAVLLNDAADALDGQPALAGGPPAATRSGTTSDITGSGAVAARRGDVWWAATLRPSHLDLRYQPGLEAIQVRDRGDWHELLPARPKVGAAHSLWPAPAGCSWRAAGPTRLRCAGARLAIAVDVRARRVLLRLRLRPGATATGRLHLPDPRIAGPRRLTWTTGSLTATGPLAVSVAPGPPRSSATTTGLRAVSYRVRADRRGRATVSIGR